MEQLWWLVHIVGHIVADIVVDIVGSAGSGHIVVGTVAGIVAYIGRELESVQRMTVHRLACRLVGNIVELEWW